MLIQIGDVYILFSNVLICMYLIFTDSNIQRNNSKKKIQNTIQGSISNETLSYISIHSFCAVILLTIK